MIALIMVVKIQTDDVLDRLSSLSDFLQKPQRERESEVIDMSRCDLTYETWLTGQLINFSETTQLPSLSLSQK